MREAVLDQRDDLAERLGGDQIGAQLARHRDRDVDRLGLHLGFDVADARSDAPDGDVDLFHGERDTAVALGFGLALASGEAVLIGARLGFRDLLGDLGRGCGLLARPVGRCEVVVEQEFCRSGHQYTSSSSARFLVSMISPLAARSLARLTSSAWASSTSRRRTGPIAAMSSWSILAAREDMLPRRSCGRPRWRS